MDIALVSPSVSWLVECACALLFCWVCDLLACDPRDLHSPKPHQALSEVPVIYTAVRLLPVVPAWLPVTWPVRPVITILQVCIQASPGPGCAPHGAPCAGAWCHRLVRVLILSSARQLYALKTFAQEFFHKNIQPRRRGRRAIWRRKRIDKKCLCLILKWPIFSNWPRSFRLANYVVIGHVAFVWPITW